MFNRSSKDKPSQDTNPTPFGMPDVHPDAQVVRFDPPRACERPTPVRCSAPAR